MRDAVCVLLSTRIPDFTFEFVSLRKGFQFELDYE